jgi:hypothetical protein
VSNVFQEWPQAHVHRAHAGGCHTHFGQAIIGFSDLAIQRSSD